MRTLVRNFELRQEQARLRAAEHHSLLSAQAKAIDQMITAFLPELKQRHGFYDQTARDAAETTLAVDMGVSVGKASLGGSLGIKVNHALPGVGEGLQDLQ